MPLPEGHQNEAPKSARDRIYEALLEWIVDGVMAPGEKLSDTEIATYFSVSRTPVREAMQVLAEQRLIEILPARESRVTEIDFDRVREYYTILAELHGLALQFAFDRITPAVLTDMNKANEAFAAAARNGDPKKLMAADQRFHNTYLDLTDDGFVQHFCQTLNAHVARFEIRYYDHFASGLSSVSEHKEIINALAEKDLTKAVEAVRLNWLHTADILEQKKP